MAPENNHRPTNGLHGPHTTIRPNGPRVRELRLAQGLTQEALAERALCGKRTLEDIEKGQRNVLVETLASVAGALGVPLEEVAARRLGPTGSETGNWIVHTPDGANSPVPPRPAPPPLVVEDWPPNGENGSKCSVLVVDDETILLPVVVGFLSGEFEVLTASSAAETEAIFARRPIDIILADHQMPRRTGVELLEWVREHYPRTVRLLMTGRADLEDVVDAINRSHVYHYVAKPFDSMSSLMLVMRNAAEKVQLERGRDKLLEDLHRSNEELKEANELLHQYNCELVRMVNRRAIEDLARFELKRNRRYPGPLSVGLIQVDPFTLPEGEDREQAGERLLEELGRVLAVTLREVDSVGRLDGERFLIIARETGQDGAARLAERIRATVASHPFRCRDRRLGITISVAFVVAAPGGPADLESVIETGTLALTEPQMAGGNRSVVLRLAAPQPEGRG